MSTSLDLSPSQTLRRPLARELARSQKRMERIVAWHALASSELSWTFHEAGYQGITRLDSLEQQAQADHLQGKMSAQKWNEFYRRIEAHRRNLLTLADEAGWIISDILAK